MMKSINLKRHFSNNLLNIRVVPNSSKQEIIEDNEQIKVYLKSVPDKNKANDELVKLFKKMFRLKVEIKSGAKSRNKVLKVLE
ncbi:YggU family protein [archaeon]|nr:YggU family protein [archaeon]MBT3451699.1 YggU family protein [archaeon]MBT6869787.1 YggU family protein [archaeon]MBT7192742.1 YggU family protein [archaeon]MBT7380767.1 YggU family protein [archaeon]